MPPTTACDVFSGRFQCVSLDIIVIFGVWVAFRCFEVRADVVLATEVSEKVLNRSELPAACTYSHPAALHFFFVMCRFPVFSVFSV